MGHATMMRICAMRDRGESIPFRLIREAHAEGATKVALMDVLGLSGYSLNQALRRASPQEEQP